MKAKAYLQEIKKLDMKINNKQLQLSSLWDLAQSITSTIKEINVQTSKSVDPMADTVSKIIDLQDEINRDIDRYVDKKLEAIRLINQLENEQYISILVRRYVNYEEWRTIADEMHYTRQSIVKKHDAALKDFQKVLDNEILHC